MFSPETVMAVEPSDFRSKQLEVSDEEKKTKNNMLIEIVVAIGIRYCETVISAISHWMTRQKK